MKGTSRYSERVRASALLGWHRSRVATAIGMTILAAGFLLMATGMAADPTAGPLRYVSLATASILAGLLAGSYVRAPIGAGATFCDLRWPVIGLFGTIWANSPRQAAPSVQIVIGILALSVMAWALYARLKLERHVIQAAAAAPEGAEPEVCTDCRPLFPVKVSPRQ
ncbi:MAG: hypothetical protein HIU81_11865 [Acidobacteria bacterium]|nr:hypothetical protein [Acidobacteriota bacterium]